MTTLLVSHQLESAYGAELAAVAKGNGIALDILALPADREARLTDADCARIDIAFFSLDVVPDFLRGQTALVLGVGQIGRKFARLARALGLKVIGVRRNATQSDNMVDELHPPQRLAELLRRSDWLVIACPLTDDTRGLITTEALGQLPSGERLLNEVSAAS